MNKYNIRAIRKELDDHVRNRAWKRLQSRLTSLLATSDKRDLFEAVVLQKSAKVANGGSLLHAILKQRHESILSLATTLVRAVPQALMVQDAQMQTPLHIAIGKSQPPEMMEVFLEVLKDYEANEQGESSTSSCSSQISVVNAMSIQDQAGDTPLLKAARENETKFIPIFLRHDKSLCTLLIQQKRKTRTALSYMASNELHNAYKYNQYVLPTELKLVLIGTYFSLMRENQQMLPETEVQLWEKLMDRSASSTTNTYNIKTRMATINEDNDGVRLVARALVGCSHLLGKYAIKLMDFLLENDIYRDCFLSQEVDHHGNFMVHCICSRSINDSDGNATTTNVLLLEQLQQMRTKFAMVTRQANREGNMPLHLAVTTCQMDLIAPLVEACPVALERVNCRGELPLHIAMKLPDSSIVQHSATRFSQSIARCLWTARPGSLEVRDGQTLLYPFQLAACSEWGPRLQEHRDESDDNVVVITGRDKTTDASCQTSSKQGDAEWVDVIYTLLLAAPQVVT